MKIAGWVLMSFLVFCIGYALFDMKGCNLPDIMPHKKQEFLNNVDYHPYKGIYYKGKGRNISKTPISNSSTSSINQQDNVSFEAHTNDIDADLSKMDNLASTIVKEYIYDKGQYYNNKEPDFFNGKVYTYGNSVKSMEQTTKEYFEIKQGEFNTTQRAKLNDIYSRLDLLRQQINSDIGRNEF